MESDFRFAVLKSVFLSNDVEYGIDDWTNFFFAGAFCTREKAEAFAQAKNSLAEKESIAILEKLREECRQIPDTIVVEYSVLDRDDPDSFVGAGGNYLEW